MKAKYLIRVRKGLSWGWNRWYWRLESANGKILAYSEYYDTRRNCFDTVDELIKTFVPKLDVIVEEKTKKEKRK